MAIKAVIFDLDGTITRPCLDFDVIREEMGLSNDETAILEIMETMSAEDLRRAKEVLRRHEDEAVENSLLNPGVEELIDFLRRKNISIGVLTRNTRENVLSVVSKHNLEFDEIIGREDGPPKPDAFGVLALCEKFNVTPVETIVVGDYLHDLLCAKAAGAKAVLLKSHPSADKFAEHADFTIEHLNEVALIIENEL